ncbi:MAG: hypothetical protein ACOYVD_14790 [Bacillota bacterium]
MIKKHFIKTITTVALGLSLVGVANADTVENLMPKIKDSMEPQFKMSQQEKNVNMQNMLDTSMVKQEKNAEVNISTKDNEETDGIIKMNPTMPNQSEMLEVMDEVHQGNYEMMLETHESMPHNQMHGNFENNSTNNNIARSQMGPQMHSSGMNRQMMGR